jgi:hypothetical protein
MFEIFDQRLAKQNLFNTKSLFAMQGGEQCLIKGDIDMTAFHGVANSPILLLEVMVSLLSRMKQHNTTYYKTRSQRHHNIYTGWCLEVDMPSVNIRI